MKSVMRGGITTLAVMAGLVVGESTISSASAAKWHKGIPKALRGEWEAAKMGPIRGFRPSMSIKQNGLETSGIDPVINKHMHYRHKKGSHVYYVKGHETLYSHGKLVNYYKFKLHKTNRKHKSHKAKFYIYLQRGNNQDWRAKKANYGHYFYK